MLKTRIILLQHMYNHLKGRVQNSSRAVSAMITDLGCWVLTLKGLAIANPCLRSNARYWSLLQV